MRYENTLIYKKKNVWIRNYYSQSYQDFSVYRAIFSSFRYVSISLPRKCLGYLDTDTMRYTSYILVHVTRREKRQEKEENRKTQEKQLPGMHLGRMLNHDGTRLMFASRTVSLMVCPSDGQQRKDDKYGQTGDKARRGQRQGANAKRRPQQAGRFSLKTFLPRAFGSSRVISHDTSR